MQALCAVTMVHRKMRITPAICTQVFTLPDQAAAIAVPFIAAIVRSEVMINSRARMINTIQPYIKPRSMNTTIAAQMEQLIPRADRQFAKIRHLMIFACHIAVKKVGKAAHAEQHQRDDITGHSANRRKDDEKRNSAMRANVILFASVITCPILISICGKRPQKLLYGLCESVSTVIVRAPCCR